MKHIFFAFSWIFLSVGVILTGIAGWYVSDLYQQQGRSIHFSGLASLDPSSRLAQLFGSTEHENFAEMSASIGASDGDTAHSLVSSDNMYASSSDLAEAGDYLTDQASQHAILAAADSVPGSVMGVSSIVEITDSRAVIVERFLERHNSPLEPHAYYGEILVAIADKYEIDFRLLPAIMMQESGLCKHIPEGSNNCLGFGIHSRGTLGFDTYEAGFERAAREIKANYIDQGLTTPEEIMRKYTPSSNGSWANSVNQWFAEMRYDDRELGRTQKVNADVLEFVDASVHDE